ncbi:MAG: membrane protein insertase YidC [Xanthomonadales bacterium]|nr:membrane protein insertase YidC [Xanthomonadales bacterium]
MRGFPLKSWLFAISVCAAGPALAHDVIEELADASYRFSPTGDLISVTACHEDCTQRRQVITAPDGLVRFDQQDGRWTTQRNIRRGGIELRFMDTSERYQRIWLIPNNGGALRLETGSGFRMAAGPEFRGPPAPGFGRWLERVRYVHFEDDEVEAIELDEPGVHRLNAANWFGFRNRFWVALARPELPVTAYAETSAYRESAEVRVPRDPTVRQWRFYFGPMAPERLRIVDEGLLDLLYSSLWFWLRWICFGLANLLAAIHSVVPVWGVAIMLLSVAVSLLMWPLTRIADVLQDQVNVTEARLAPALADIKRRYKGAEQAEATLALYKAAGVHPLYSLKSLAGIALVLPVFIGAFDMLAENIHLAGVSFLWIEDLARPDAVYRLPFTIPFFGGYLNALPLVMTGLSITAAALHQPPALELHLRRRKLRNLLLMALAFLVLFYTFPAGMVLYWTTNNLVSVIKGLWKLRDDQHTLGKRWRKLRR